MSSATIIFSDVVGFSKFSSSSQKIIVNSLTNEIMYEIREYLVNNLSLIPNAIALPTGDGVAVVLIHNEPDVWKKETIIKILMRLVGWQKRIGEEKLIRKDIKIRIGTHHGSVEFFTDINGNTNVCGNTINMAQRVMDAANESQILISEEVIKKYFGSDFKEVINYENKQFSISFSGPTTVTVKHSVRIIVYNLRIVDFSGYDNNPPDSSRYLVLTTTKLPKKIEGDFELKIKTAWEIALIQLTGENILEKLENDKEYLSNELRRFFVLMPSEQSPIFAKNEMKHLQKKQKIIIERWRQTISGLKIKYKSTIIELVLFNEPPYYGASYINWSKPGGFIHISPYIWGVKASECPGYDMIWNRHDEPEIYQKYVMGLDHLMGVSK